MKKLIVGTLVVFALVWASPPAQAEFFSVAVDVPVAFGFDDPLEANVKEVSGAKFSVSFPFLVGLGYENYDVTQTKSGIDPVTNAVVANKDFVSTITMVDIFFTLPIPVINIVLGLGRGKAKFAGPNSQFLNNADLTQYYLSVGIPFAAILDLHVGYHVISGEADPSTLGVSQGITTKKIIDGNMTSIGLKLGF